MNTPSFGDTKSSEEIFEEIDRELNKFDPNPDLASKLLADTGKENFLESLSLNDTTPLATQNAHQPLPSEPTSCVPLSVLSDNNLVPIVKETTWKRITKKDIGSDTIMKDLVGEK